jgi:hypothetical protein
MKRYQFPIVWCKVNSIVNILTMSSEGLNSSYPLHNPTAPLWGGTAHFGDNCSRLWISSFFPLVFQDSFSLMATVSCFHKTRSGVTRDIWLLPCLLRVFTQFPISRAPHWCHISRLLTRSTLNSLIINGWCIYIGHAREKIMSSAEHLIQLSSMQFCVYFLFVCLFTFLLNRPNVSYEVSARKSRKQSKNTHPNKGKTRKIESLLH